VGPLQLRCIHPDRNMKTFLTGATGLIGQYFRESDSVTDKDQYVCRDHSFTGINLSAAVNSWRWRGWIVAAVLYVVVSYPYQAVVFPWLGAFPQVTYAVLCMLGILIMFSHRGARVPLEHRRQIVLGVCLLTCSMLTTLALDRNPTVVRDLLLLGLLATLLFKTRGSETVQIVRSLIHISTMALVPAMLVVAMFYTGLIDWPSWNVERLGLPSSNPLSIRAGLGDFDYYLPLWVAIVPHLGATDQGFGLQFVRQPFLYIEPADTWLYTSGLFWLAVADSKLPGRTICLSILGLALALSFSVVGVLATIAALMFCVAMAAGGGALVMLLLGAVATLFAILPIDQMLALVGSNKADQFAYYAANVSLLNDLTMFGHSTSPDEQPLSYGFLIVLNRYGVIGAAVILGVILALGFAYFRLLRDASALGWRRYPIFIACFVSLAMLTKYPGIVPAMPAICLGTALSLRLMRIDPLSMSLVR
jgi:hypothetical protein